MFHRTMDRIKELGWHVVLHVDAPDIVPLTEMMSNLPVPFVIDQMGRVDSALGVEQPAFKALLELTRLPSCWVKVSGSERISKPPYDAALPFARALIEASPERGALGARTSRIPISPSRPMRLTSSISCPSSQPRRRSCTSSSSTIRPAFTALGIGHQGTRYDNDQDECSKPRPFRAIPACPSADFSAAFLRAPDWPHAGQG